MVKVYFENKGTADLIAVFADEDTYELYSPLLKKLAKESKCILTESITSDCIEEVFDER